jgi:RNA polymerase sigma-70 factor (ECF subfamily)
LLRRHEGRFYAGCRRLAGIDADALDATQEALIAVVRGLDRFDGRSAFSTWAHRVATNACLDELRRRSRRPMPGLDTEIAESTGTIRDDAPSVASRTADRLDIDAALQTLPEEYRAAVVLRDQLGMDYAEISEVLEIPPGTVRSRIARGRAALARALHDDLGNQEPTDQRPSTEP